jgi:hypothetical protein
MDATLRFRTLASAAMVDGEIQPEERILLMNAAKRMGLRLQETHALLNRTHHEPDFVPPVPAHPSERVTLFMEIADILAADGIVQESEMKLLKRVAPSFGFHPDKVERITEMAKASTKRLLKILSGNDA